jgi:hypothetical protein
MGSLDDETPVAVGELPGLAYRRSSFVHAHLYLRAIDHTGDLGLPAPRLKSGYG